jgi:uroporphyrin-III C-methyltransferase
VTRAWLIGAGPGDAELMTIKATRALAAADVVLVDDLVNPDVLQFARPGAEIVYVGKRGGRPSTPQAEIIAQMLGYVRAGRSVARLKGGDPFVFGRGGEEMLALEQAGIAVEIVNGITAGIAAPAALGIPVTHRGLAQGVAFVTGHGAADEEPDWRALVGSRLTLVIYMGVRRLDAIVAQLLDAGMAADTPCAAIESATWPDQRHALATLRSLPQVVKETSLGSPSIIVVGDVAALGKAPMARMAAGGDDEMFALGIGCKAGATANQIEAAVSEAFGDRSLERVACVATIAAKMDEPGLVAFCARHRLRLAAFDVEAINACIAAHPTLARSAAVRERFGVDGISEPCALLAAPGGRLVAGKHARDGVTVAVAACAQQPASAHEKESSADRINERTS